MTDPRVLLIGMMGSGKTTVGRALSELTGWPYRDNDEIVAEVEGISTDELLAQRGEKELRAAESRALAKVLSDRPPVIAGVAGGVVTSPADRALLSAPEGFTVYLYAPLEVLVDRVGSGEGRPWLQPDPEKALSRLLDGRDSLYREVADLVVDTSQGDPEAQARQIKTAVDGPAAAG